MLVAVGLVMGMNAWAAVGDKVTIVDQAFPGALESTETYTWGSELEGMMNGEGLYMTNQSNASNNYENRDFLTFSNAIGDETHETNVSYEVYCPKDKGQDPTYYTISYFNKEGDLIFAIQEYSGKWAFGCNVIYTTESGTETAALPKSHISKGGGSVVNLSVNFTGNKAVITIDGNIYSAYTQSAGIKAIKLSVTGGNGYDRDMYIKNYKVETTEAAAVQVAKYTLKYVAGDVTIKTVEKNGTIGESIALKENEIAALYNEDNTQKYIYVSNDAEGKTIAEDGSTVVTITYRAAEKFSYTLKSNLGGIIKEGSDWEGETFNIAYPRYLVQDGTLYSASKGSAGWYLTTINLTENNVEKTIEYTADATGIVFLSEAEDIETLTVSTAANSDARCSNGLGAYNAGEDDALIVNLPSGKYKLYTSTWGGTGVVFTFKAGDTTIGTVTCLGYIQDYNTEEFVLSETSTPITLGATTNAARCIDFIYIQKTGEANEEVSVGDAGLATYTPSTDLDFTNATKIAAYKASVSGNEVTLTKVTTVAKEEGVLLRSIEGGAVTENIAVAATATKNEGNAFVGTLTDITVNETDGNNTNYVLSKENGVMGFYKAKTEADGGTKVAAGKAYLPVATADAAKGIKVVFDGETTGISTVKGDNVKDNTIYNLNGQRVAAPAKGLYIMNGKKFIVK